MLAASANTNRCVSSAGRPGPEGLKKHCRCQEHVSASCREDEAKLAKLIHGDADTRHLGSEAPALNHPPMRPEKRAYRTHCTVQRFGPLEEVRGTAVLYKESAWRGGALQIDACANDGRATAFWGSECGNGLFVPRYGRERCKAVGRGLFISASVPY